MNLVAHAIKTSQVRRFLIEFPLVAAEGNVLLQLILWQWLGILGDFLLFLNFVLYTYLVLQRLFLNIFLNILLWKFAAKRVQLFLQRFGMGKLYCHFSSFFASCRIMLWLFPTSLQILYILPRVFPNHERFWVVSISFIFLLLLHFNKIK